MTEPADAVVVACVPCAVPRRVPCPLDPSHTVLETRVASHLTRCGSAARRASEAAAPYFSARINDLTPAPRGAPAHSPVSPATAAARRGAAALDDAACLDLLRHASAALDDASLVGAPPPASDTRVLF